MNIQALSTFSICLCLSFMFRLSSKSLKISFSVLDVSSYVIRLKQFSSRQIPSQHTHLKKKSVLGKTEKKLCHRGKEWTQPAERRREKMFKVTFIAVTYLSFQPNQNVFLGHFPRLHSWIRENLGVPGEPAGGQYPRKDSSWAWRELGLGVMRASERALVLRWHFLFCFVGTPTHQEERRMKSWYIGVQSLNWGGGMQKDNHKSKARVLCTA